MGILGLVPGFDLIVSLSQALDRSHVVGDSLALGRSLDLGCLVHSLSLDLGRLVQGFDWVHSLALVFSLVLRLFVLGLDLILDMGSCVRYAVDYRLGLVAFRLGLGYVLGFSSGLGHGFNCGLGIYLSLELIIGLGLAFRLNLTLNHDLRLGHSFGHSLDLTFGFRFGLCSLVALFS